MSKLSHLRTNSGITPIQRRIAESQFSMFYNKGEIKDAMFLHSVLCQAFLPYRDPKANFYQRKQGKAVLLLESGKVLDNKTGNYIDYGLPYGARARIILAYANTQSVRSQSPIVSLESCLHAFLKSMGWGTDGRTRRAVEEQIKRILGTQIKVGFVEDEKGGKRVQSRTLQLVSDYDLWYASAEEQNSLFPSFIKFSDNYFNSLMEHAIPLDERALASLSHNALAIDIYCWLAQRLHRIPEGKPQFITWAALKDQFGHGYKTMKRFKESFRKRLLLARSQYLGARIEEDLNKGFNLYNSRSPIAPKSTLVSFPKDSK
ncbi:MAG: replication protein RepA [Pseudomonadota bacterium]